LTAVRIGVISDTHIPDRAAGLHPALLEELRNRQVDLILHAGDISVPGVLRTLEEIAPVKAVRGNRDILFPGGLPNTLEMTINGVPLVLTHGHLNFLTYWWDKLQYIFRGYERRRFTKRLGEAFPLARVIVYGHTHRAENVSLDESSFSTPALRQSAIYGCENVHSVCLKLRRMAASRANWYRSRGSIWSIEDGSLRRGWTNEHQFGWISPKSLTLVVCCDIF
jgi:phosphoesterase, MJ0936 family